MTRWRVTWLVATVLYAAGAVWLCVVGGIGLVALGVVLGLVALLCASQVFSPRRGRGARS